MTLNGYHAVVEALRHNATGIIYITCQHKSFKKILYLAQKNNCQIIELNQNELKAMGGRQGILFKTKPLHSTYVANLKQWLKNKESESLCVLILDHILDPQNLGAIIRSATLLGIQLIIQPERRNAPENELAARSAAGGLSIMPRCNTNNLSNVITILKEHNIWVYALDMSGIPISGFKLPNRCAFVLGGEHKGVSALLKKNSDSLLSIPNNKKLESFNVGVSASFACYEYFIQHLYTE